MPASDLSHKLYKRLRPYLYDWGILKIIRLLFKQELRRKVASYLGLEGFNRAQATGRTLPEWAKYKKTHTPISLDGVNIIGDLQVDSGISEVTRKTYSTLQVVGIPTAYYEIRFAPQSRDHLLPQNINFGTPYNINLIDIHFSLFYDAVMEASAEIFAKKYNIAYWGWELPKFPDISHQIFQMIDEVWVYSRFVQDSISQVSSVPVVCIPPAIQIMPSLAPNRKDFGLPQDRVIFLFSFSPISMLARKNPFGLVEAFRYAFGNNPQRALLVIKSHHTNLMSNSERFRNDLQQAVKSVGGIFIDANFSRQQMTDLIAVSDCYVSLHRAEGFGLGMAEAMALGKPVIATHYSGNTDFMNVSNSYCVKYNLRDITEEDHEYQPEFKPIFSIGQIWAEPDLHHAAELMNYVVEHPEEAQKIGVAATTYIQQHLSPSVVGQRILNRLQLIASQKI